MEKELENLITLAGTPKFDTGLRKVYKKYKSNPEAQKHLSGLIQKELSGIQQDLLTIKKELSLKKNLRIYLKWFPFLRWSRSILIKQDIGSTNGSMVI
ncbi:MAG: hypothetical protein J0H29_21625 [Sphingobacteriales bacterium]|nr:hypothetical protein [Sphingobacteriales bacterium]OJY90261.1 MAG: hypothetical protein BGP14_11300 [Sphingobacteriales bacterium 44-15]